MPAEGQAHSACGTPCVTHQEFIEERGHPRWCGWCSLLEKGGACRVPAATLFTWILLSGRALESWLCWEVTGEDGVRERV